MNNETILSGQAGLAGIQWALESRPSRRALRQGLMQNLLPGCAVGRLKLTRAKFKLQSRLQAYYTVTASDPQNKQARTVPIEVTWKPPEKFSDPEAAEDPEVEAIKAEAKTSGLLAPFLNLQYDLPARGIRMRIWPLDPQFPQLVRLGNPAYTPQLFKSAGVPLEFVENDCIQITPIRYRPGERHVLRYQVDRHSAVSAGERLYAKIYREPLAAARAFRVANKVVSWLGENQHGFGGIRPVGIAQEDGVILYPHAPGAPLSQQLTRSPRWLSRYLRMVGEGLASLHEGPESLVMELEGNILEKEVRVIARASQHLQALLPEVGAQVLRILDRAQELNRGLPQEEPTFTHSDFKADHLFVSRTGITLIDFDTCALADPALDIGKFLADLEWWYEHNGLAGFEQAQQEFLKGYGGVDGSGLLVGRGRLERAQMYQSLILTKITIRRARLYSKKWASLTTRMIQRAEEILAEI